MLSAQGEAGVVVASVIANVSCVAAGSNVAPDLLMSLVAHKVAKRVHRLCVLFTRCGATTRQSWQRLRAIRWHGLDRVNLWQGGFPYMSRDT